MGILGAEQWEGSKNVYIDVEEVMRYPIITLVR